VKCLIALTLLVFGRAALAQRGEWVSISDGVGPNYAWDVKNDVFYASRMGKHTYGFER
jgi:hypothetical protein